MLSRSYQGDRILPLGYYDSLLKPPCGRYPVIVIRVIPVVVLPLNLKGGNGTWQLIKQLI